MADLKISALTASTTPLAGTEVLPIVQSSTTKQVSVANLTAGRNVSLAQLTATATTQKLGAVTSADITVQIGPDTPVTTSSGRILFNTSSTEKNWFLTHNWNVAGAVALTQSTAAGGSTMSGTDSHQWLSNGDYKIVNGNVVIGTSGKGIDFSATSGSGTSELLADYEEGTYTPTFTPSTSGTLVLNSADSRNKFVYTKTGRSVAITGYVQFLGSSTPVGTSVTISLPFAAYDGGGTIGGAGIVAVFNGVTYLFNLNAGASTMTWTIAASSITDGLFLTLSFNYTAT